MKRFAMLRVILRLNRPSLPLGLAFACIVATWIGLALAAAGVAAAFARPGCHLRTG